MLKHPGAVLLVSCYEMGHQPLALASPLALLHEAGYEPAVVDLAVEPIRPETIAAARVIAISVPMHTALRIGVRLARRIRSLNPGCHLCFYGLYATLNADWLLSESVADSIIGGEYEEPLVNLVASLETGETAAVPGVGTAEHSSGPWLRRIRFAVPRRAPLPALQRYARLESNGLARIAGQVEASRGCLHHCRHCPIPPVYGGRFFVVPREVVLADIRNQVRAGATHITFGDADFLNGPGHVLPIVESMHAESPDLTFDFTAKVTHLLAHRDRLPELARLGCLFVVSAVESLNDDVLAILDKGHRRDDILAVVDLMRRAGISLRPSLVPFTPWSGLDDYRELLAFIADEDLVDRIDPVQMSLRLLIPPGSLLAGHDAVRPHLGPLDQERLTFTWSHPDPRVDDLQQRVSTVVARAAAADEDPRHTYRTIAALAWESSDGPVHRPACSLRRPTPPMTRDKGRPPRLTEPWFC